MTISATVKVSDMLAANAELEAAGHGPNSFSVPLRTGNAEATHAGLHCWDNPDFLAALQSVSVPSLKIRHDPGEDENFRDHVQAEGVDWSDVQDWLDPPVMKGDTRQFGGKTWESERDYNPWPPSIRWREMAQS